MIRPALKSDTETLLALTEGTGYFHPAEIETLEGVLYDFFDHAHHFQHRAFVWEEEQRVLGFIYHAWEEMTARTWYIWWLAVAADQQGRGIGGRLLAFAEQDIRDSGGRLLAIETSSTEKYEPTRQFYLKHGYAHVATVPDLYADGDGMAVFTKRVGRGQ